MLWQVDARLHNIFFFCGILLNVDIKNFRLYFPNTFGFSLDLNHVLVL